MGKRQYKEDNKMFLKRKAREEGVVTLPSGILYEVLESGDATAVSPSANSIVSVYYTGQLISGVVFDNNLDKSCAEALRLSNLIEGWQIALQQMHPGDKWRIYIPSALGYGDVKSGDIPKYSTLIFEIKLVAVS